MMRWEEINKEPVTEVAIRFQDCDPFGHFDLTKGQLITHSEDLMELFEKIAKTGVNTDDFDERIKEVIRLHKN